MQNECVLRKKLIEREIEKKRNEMSAISYLDLNVIARSDITTSPLNFYSSDVFLKRGLARYDF